MTQEEKNAAQRVYRSANGNKETKKYEKTKKGFLMRLHRNMRSRVAGIQKNAAHLYSHIVNVVPRDEFYEWSLSSSVFHSLFDAWEASGYERRLTPSIDRVNAKGEYVFDNMEWVTQSENSRRASASRTKLTPEIVTKVRELWAEKGPNRCGAGSPKTNLVEELGITYHLAYAALDDDYVRRHKLI